MDEECVEQFRAITGADNKVRVLEFCEMLQWNLESALESYFQSPEIHHEFMLNQQQLLQELQPPQQQASPPQQRRPQQPAEKTHVYQVHVFEGRKFRNLQGDSVLSRWWRLHLSLNGQNFDTRPAKQGASPEWNQRVVITLPAGDVGILTLELRDLSHRVLASGAAALALDMQGSQWVPLGAVGEVRVDVALADHERRAKLRRCGSYDDISDSCLFVPLDQQNVSLARVRKEGRFHAVSTLFNSGMTNWGAAGRPVRPLEQRCAFCHQSVEFESMMKLSACEHAACRACVARRASSQLASRAVASCAVCSSELAYEEVAQVLSRVQLNAYDDLKVELLLEADASFTRCPSCQTPMEKMLTRSGDLDAPAEGGGEPLHGEALHHYNRHRLRCYSCHANFCSSCLQEPYHVGYTCETFATFAEATHCRYCNAVVRGAVDVCSERECKDKYRASCKLKLPCGHRCYGVAGESACAPCLHADCEQTQQSGDDFCNICWVEGLAAAPCLTLECGHVFHAACLRTQIESGWPGDRITFGFLDCSLCKKQIRHPMLDDLLAPLLQLYEKISANATKRLKVEGMLKDAKLVEPGSAFYNKPTLYALRSFAYYKCFKCGKAFFGGRRDCENNMQEDREAEEMVCFDCGDMDGLQVDCVSPKEHREWHVWKCRYCCSTAVWFCWGNTSFCDPCHQVAYKKRDQKKFPVCAGADACPLKVDHPPHGKEFSLGCGLCRDKYQQNSKFQRLSDDEEDEDEREEEEAEAEKEEEESSSGVEIITNLVRNAFGRRLRKK